MHLHRLPQRGSGRGFPGASMRRPSRSPREQKRRSVNKMNIRDGVHRGTWRESCLVTVRRRVEGGSLISLVRQGLLRFGDRNVPQLLQSLPPLFALLNNSRNYNKIRISYLSDKKRETYRPASIETASNGVNANDRLARSHLGLKDICSGRFLWKSRIFWQITLTAAMFTTASPPWYSCTHANWTEAGHRGKCLFVPLHRRLIERRRRFRMRICWRLFGMPHSPIRDRSLSLRRAGTCRWDIQLPPFSSPKQPIDTIWKLYRCDHNIWYR